MLPGALQLMKHQAEVVAAAADGHRTFLLADEPGLGKTAQALLAAEAADAFPMLAVVPNVVKTNWAREANIWVPHRMPTVIHGDGQDINGFADVVVVNYEVLDRHVGWLGDFGFRSMVVDEAHFIKNKTSQRSQNVLQLSERIRSRTGRPLFFALTGTPLINDIEDFRAIWQYLGWIDDKKPLGALMDALEETGLTPADHGFYPAARTSVVDQGIVRRRKVDVAKDIPARRIADIPVELDDEIGRSIREAEAELARRLVARYESALATRRTEADLDDDGIDHDLVRRVATWEREDSSDESTRRERLRHDAPDRPGQGRSRRRLRRPAGAQRRQGRLLRQAHRRDGRRPGHLRQARPEVLHDPRRPDPGRPRAQHQGVRGGPGRRRDRLLAERGRRRHQPAGGLEPRAGGAVVDRRRADPGHRPGAPDRSGRARHRLADHRRADHRHQGRRADRQQGRAGRASARRPGHRGLVGRRAGRGAGGAAHRGALAVASRRDRPPSPA